jgi:hypothetical protein
MNLFGARRRRLHIDSPRFGGHPVRLWKFYVIRLLRFLTGPRKISCAKLGRGFEVSNSQKLAFYTAVGPQTPPQFSGAQAELSGRLA